MFLPDVIIIVASTVFVSAFSIHQQACLLHSSSSIFIEDSVLAQLWEAGCQPGCRITKKYLIRQNYEEQADDDERTGNIFTSQNIGDDRMKQPMMGPRGFLSRV